MKSIDKFVVYCKKKLGLIKVYKSENIILLENQFEKLLVNAKKDEGIVISLKGSWGVGKTYFWNNYAPHKWKQDKHVYVSLFGKSSLDDIKREIVMKISDLGKAGGFLAKFPDFQILGNGINLSSLSSLISEKHFQDIVICFDDFERISTNLSISEILGYIAELKEQKKCKIVIINNNDELSNLDSLNEQVFKKSNKVVYTLSNSNNNEIFRSYSEKLVDYELVYEPSLKDSFNLFSKSIDRFDKDNIISLIEQVKDKNKRFNIRYMKKYISKLSLLNFLNNEKNIDNIFFETISLQLFLKIYNININEINISFSRVNLFTLNEELDYIIEKHLVRKELFLEKLVTLNNDYLQNLKESTNIKQINETYNRYIYDLNYKDEKFVDDMFNLISDNKDNIVSLISFNTFENYITRLKELDKDNGAKYNNLFDDCMKPFINSQLKKYNRIDFFEREEFETKLENYKSIKDYYDNEKEQISKEKTNNKNEIKSILSNIRKNGGWSPSEIKALSDITPEKHLEWILSDSEYNKKSFGFAQWLDTFAGERPFNEYYSNLRKAHEELNKKPEYKYRLELMNRYFSK